MGCIIAGHFHHLLDLRDILLIQNTYVHSTFLLFSLLAIQRMSEVGKGTDEDPSVDTEVPPCVGDSNPPKRRKRIPKKCLKCGKSVQNLSRHQEEVHGMSKLKRKLNVYLSGEKKPPKGRVKFCPLSPCKRQRTPIFQLHKHLKSNVHKLEVGSRVMSEH